MSDSVHLRPGRPGEAGELSELALRSKAHWGYGQAFLSACRAELTYSAAQIGDPRFCFVIAEFLGRPAGFYALVNLDDGQCELEALFVTPERIGQGLGGILFRHAAETARGQGADTLMILGDPHADGFYRAMGCQRIGQRESASIPGRDLPLYALNLQDIG